MGMDILSRDTTLSKSSCFSSEKGFTLKGKNLLPLKASFFFCFFFYFIFRVDPFQKGLVVQESKQSQKVVPLLGNCQKSTYAVPLMWCPSKHFPCFSMKTYALGSH